jgi:hypothetical protein
MAQMASYPTTTTTTQQHTTQDPHQPPATTTTTTTTTTNTTTYTIGTLSSPTHLSSSTVSSTFNNDITPPPLLLGTTQIELSSYPSTTQHTTQDPQQPHTPASSADHQHSKDKGVLSTSIPTNMEVLLAQKSRGKDWLTPQLMNELKDANPKPSHIDSLGQRNAESLAHHCNELFFTGRVFCSFNQLAAMLTEFSKAWGFEVARDGMCFKCHFAATKQNKKSVVSPSKQRKSAPSAKESIQCPFIIRFANDERMTPENHYIMTKNNIRKVISGAHYFVKITSHDFSHTCNPSAQSQRYAKSKSGKEAYHLDDVQDVLDLMLEFGGVENKMLRALLKARLPHHINIDDQFLRNFKQRALRIMYNQNDASQGTGHEVKKLLHGNTIAANECIKFDNITDERTIQTFRMSFAGGADKYR